MSRRYFEHMYNEICVAVGRRVSRYGLWLLVWEAGGDPDDLTCDQVHAFLDQHFETFLREEGLRLEGRPRRRLEQALLCFDPRRRTPEEWMAAATEL